MKRIWGENYLTEVEMKWQKDGSPEKESMKRFITAILVDRKEWEEACKLLNEMENRNSDLEKIITQAKEAGVPINFTFKEPESQLIESMQALLIYQQKEIQRLSKPEFQKFERINLKPLTNE